MITEPDRLKFEWMKGQAELKAEFYATVISGAPFARQQREFNSDGAWCWNDIREDYLDWDDARTYRRKPEPTLEERNAASETKWKSMPEVASFTRLNSAGKKCVCEWLDTHAPQDGWRLNTGGIFSHPKRLEYRIRELPSPRIEPYTFETCPLGAAVEWKDIPRRGIITTVHSGSLNAGSWSLTFEDALKCLDLIPDSSKPDERRPFGLEVAP